MADADRPRHRSRDRAARARRRRGHGTAHWIARYTFSTGRPVVNDIRATFLFSDGLIADHVDEFDFRRWARQALGPTGLAVAALPPLRKAARRKARAQLDEFMQSESVQGAVAAAVRPTDANICSYEVG